MRGTTDFINSSTVGDTAQALRIQRLSLIGIIGQRAKLLAALAWEGQHD